MPQLTHAEHQLDYPAIRARLQQAMVDAGLSQGQLARQAEVNQAQISRFLAGARGLTLAALTRLGKALDVDLWIKAAPANGVRQVADPAPAAEPEPTPLGRALARDLPAPAGDPGWQRIPLARLRPSKLNPRKSFGKDDLAELADSIAAHGVLQNLVVRQVPAPGTAPLYEIVAGERRFRALQLLAKADRIGYDELVPCRVVDVGAGDAGDADHVALAIVENLQREQVAPLDEAAAFKRLVDLGWDTGRIAGAIKRSRRHVQLRLDLVSDRLSEPAKKALAKGEISVAHARVLVTVSADKQKEGLQQLVGSTYSNIKTADQLRKHLHRDYRAVDLALLPPPPGTPGLIEVDGVPMFDSQRSFAAWQADAVERRRTVLADQWAWVDVVAPYDWNSEARGYAGRERYQWQGEGRDRAPVTTDDRTAGGAVIVFDKYSGEAEIHEGILRAPDLLDGAGQQQRQWSSQAEYERQRAAQLARLARRGTAEAAIRATARTAPTLWCRMMLFGLAGETSVGAEGFNGFGDGERAILEAAPTLVPLLDDDGGWTDPLAAWAAIAALDPAELQRLASQAVIGGLAVDYDADPASDPVLQAIAEEYDLDFTPPADPSAEASAQAEAEAAE